MRILAGVRYENTRVRYDALQINDPGEDSNMPVTSTPIEGGTDYDFLLPMIHLRYALSDRANIRFAYTRSYARPNLSDVVPSQNINFADQIISTGNPDLLPADATNLDLLFENYIQGAGVISGGLFYKRIEDFIFNQVSDVEGGQFDGFRSFSPVNGDVANLYGAEINFSKKLDFLPGFLSGLGVYLNYTYVQSDSSFEFLVEDPDTGQEVVSVRDDVPFVGQADHVWNAAISFDRGGFSSRISLNYNGSSLLSFADDPELDFFLDERYQLDINASQKITDQLTIFAEFVNLTNDPNVQYQSVRSQVVNYELYSWSARFGINFKF